MRLAGTDLVVEVERHFTTCGEEVTRGGGKVIRDGMEQPSGGVREAETRPTKGGRTHTLTH